MDLKKIVNNPIEYGIYFMGRFIKGNRVADEIYLKVLFQYRMHRRLQLKNPKALNDKLQWLKLNDYKSFYTTFADKYEVRKYIAEKVGDNYLIPLLGMWNNVEEIEWDILPDQFVLKCTHDSGGVVICKDKSAFDKSAAIKKLKHCYKRNYYQNSREAAYKNIKPRIIAEKFLVDETGWDLKDYKIWCRML